MSNTGGLYSLYSNSCGIMPHVVLASCDSTELRDARFFHIDIESLIPSEVPEGRGPQETICTPARTCLQTSFFTFIFFDGTKLYGEVHGHCDRTESGHTPPKISRVANVCGENGFDVFCGFDVQLGAKSARLATD